MGWYQKTVSCSQAVGGTYICCMLSLTLPSHATLRVHRVRFDAAHEYNHADGCNLEPPVRVLPYITGDNSE